MYNTARFLGVLILTFSLSLTACKKGFIQPEDLESSRVGPRECASSCYNLGLRMSALVLLNRVSACVCEPVQWYPPPPGPAPAPAPAPTKGGASRGAGAAVAAHVVLAQQEQQQQQRRAIAP